MRLIILVLFAILINGCGTDCQFPDGGTSHTDCLGAVLYHECKPPPPRGLKLYDDTSVKEN